MTQSEWASLRKQGGKGVCDETLVREYRDVQQEAVHNKTIVHFGRLFELCFEKHPELPKTNPLRKMKGRVVFQAIT